MKVKGFKLKVVNAPQQKPQATQFEEDFDPDAEYRTYDLPADTEPPPKTFLIPKINQMLHHCATNRLPIYRPHPRTSGPRATKVIHPSSAGGCARNVQFDLMGVKKDPGQVDPRMERIFAMGHMAHEQLQGYLFECWRQKVGGITRVWEDVSLKIDNLRVVGELDCVVELNHEYRYLVEIKTANKDKFDKMSKPDNKWVVQATLYMAALGLKAAIILVMCRDNGDMKEYFFEWDDDSYNQLAKKYRELQENVRTGKMAPMTTDVGECYFCNRKIACNEENVRSRGKNSRS